MITIRTIQEKDAAEFQRLCRRLDEETQFMLLEPGERVTTIKRQREQIRNTLTQDNHNIFVAESDGRLVGHVMGLGGACQRNKHSVYIVIGVLQAFTGQGLGTKLLVELEKWARAREIHRLELTVMVHNEIAIKLYKKMGFEIEGTKRHSLFVNGSFVDEYFMAKLLLRIGKVQDENV